MGKSHIFGHAACVMDITPCATRTFFGQGRAMIIELKCHADDIVAFLSELCGHNGAIHAARHCHDHTGFGGGLGKAKRIQRMRAVMSHLQILSRMPTKYK